MAVLFLCLQRITSEILNEKLASNIVFGETSIVFYAKNINEIIASVTAEQRSIAERISHELKVLKSNFRFTQRHTDILTISRYLSKKSLVDV
jgi:hypothetical protein